MYKVIIVVYLRINQENFEYIQYISQMCIQKHLFYNVTNYVVVVKS